MNWPSQPLSACATFSSGGTPNKQRPEFWDGDIPWVSSAELTCRFIDDTKLHISTDGLESGSRLVPTGTIFAVVRGMSLATEFRISLSRRPMAFNQDVKAIIPKPGIDGTFLFYALSGRADEIKDLATEAAHGTKKLEMSRLSSFRISVPGFETQRKIASIGFAYDDLIAANQRRIQLLEESARLLYREWFVKLRFPGNETVPVSEGVPDGWERRTISSLSLFLNRGIAPQYNDMAKGLVINQKCIRNGRLSMEYARRQSKEVKSDRCVQPSDILINSTGAGTLGRVALLMKNIPDCTVDTHVTIARPNDTVKQAFFGLALLSLEPAFSKMGKGATNQLELSRGDIGNVEILVPSEDVQKDFHRLAWPLLTQAQQLSDANELLKEARDLLLPKLMSGILDVSRIAVPKETAA